MIRHRMKARVASTLIEPVSRRLLLRPEPGPQAAPRPGETSPRLAARFIGYLQLLPAWSQTNSSRCPGAPYGGPGPDRVVGGRGRGSRLTA